MRNVLLVAALSMVVSACGSVVTEGSSTTIPPTTVATTEATTEATTTTASTTTTIPPTTTTTLPPTTTLPAITLRDIESRVYHDWPGTVPASMWADPVSWSCTAITDGRLTTGSVVKCVPDITAEGQYPVLTVLVLDPDGTIAVAQAGVVYDVLNADWIVDQLGSGKFCRDILAEDAGLSGLPTPELEYFGALLYWFMEDMPARMDADNNGVPCETLVPASVVSAVWAGGYVEGKAAPLDVAIVGKWEGTATVPAGWGDIGNVWFDFRSDGTYSVRHDGTESGGLYWGDDTDSPLRTYEINGPSPGYGWITVFWAPDTTQQGRLENVMIQTGHLHFELWNDWSSGTYGPVIYDLDQTG